MSFKFEHLDCEIICLVVKRLCIWGIAKMNRCGYSKPNEVIGYFNCSRMMFEAVCVCVIRFTVFDVYLVFLLSKLFSNWQS